MTETKTCFQKILTKTVPPEVLERKVAVAAAQNVDVAAEEGGRVLGARGRRRTPRAHGHRRPHPVRTFRRLVKRNPLDIEGSKSSVPRGVSDISPHINMWRW